MQNKGLKGGISLRQPALSANPFSKLLTQVRLFSGNSSTGPFELDKSTDFLLIPLIHIVNLLVSKVCILGAL